MSLHRPNGLCLIVSIAFLERLFSEWSKLKEK
jgi:hypothetical protein